MWWHQHSNISMKKSVSIIERMLQIATGYYQLKELRSMSNYKYRKSFIHHTWKPKTTLNFFLTIWEIQWHCQIKQFKCSQQIFSIWIILIMPLLHQVCIKEVIVILRLLLDTNYAKTSQSIILMFLKLHVHLSLFKKQKINLNIPSSVIFQPLVN